MQRITYDIAIVGGGILGTATARELLIRNPSLKLALIEKEKSFAAHQSGHNSGVLHTGIYYTPGSLKAKLCVEGLDLAYKYCTEKNIPYKKCGKLIVAVNENELEPLEALYKRAIENKVKDVSLINQEDIKKIEPHVSGLKAIWSPNTGIVDWGEVTKSFAEDCRLRGADVYLDFPVAKFLPINRGSKPAILVEKSKSSKNIVSDFVITCGGLHSDRLALMTKCSPQPKIVSFRGEYLVLKPEKSDLVKTNIYPVPHPNLPFLGVHITPRIDGSVWLGPNAVFAFKREGYERSSFDVDDVWECFKHEGFQKLAKRHLAYGFKEFYRGMFPSAQVQILKQYMPALERSWVARGPAGVRAQALDLDGNLVDDFIFDSGKDEFKNVLHVRNAPSPAATSSLAIAKVIADKAEENFKDIKTIGCLEELDRKKMMLR